MSQQSQQTIVTSVGVGLKLLPFFMRSLETLFGKKTGQTKKAAAQELFNAAALGTAAGFGVVGDQRTSDMINLFRPVVSATIDEVAGQLFPPAPQPSLPAAANTVGQAADQPDATANAVG
ncbi:MAG TPA: hypothetical protein VGQ12_07695 [Candidatus Angelobacter sp.]|jgi:hypothetical protein|nr:hypothetical protein [Candidatus Angelobacter sp.]